MGTSSSVNRWFVLAGFDKKIGFGMQMFGLDDLFLDKRMKVRLTCVLEQTNVVCGGCHGRVRCDREERVELASDG